MRASLRSKDLKGEGDEREGEERGRGGEEVRSLPSLVERHHRRQAITYASVLYVTLMFFFLPLPPLTPPLSLPLSSTPPCSLRPLRHLLPRSPVRGVQAGVVTLFSYA